MQMITQKIIGYKVKHIDGEGILLPEDINNLPSTSTITEVILEEVPPKGIHEKVKREDTLTGKTYKIRPGSGESYYITINNQSINEILYPMEIFINSKDVKHFQWVASITRMISAVFRKGGSIEFIVDELSAIHDPAGGYWGKDRITGKSIFYQSIVHEIGDVIKEHLMNLSKLNKDSIL